MSFTTIKKPSKAILIDAQNTNELRVAIVDNTKKKQHNILTDLHIEDKKRELYKSNIYKGKISSIEPSLNAVFVYYDDGKKHGFLPFKEIDPAYHQNKQESSATPTSEDTKEAPSATSVQTDEKEDKTEVAGQALTPEEDKTEAAGQALTPEEDKTEAAGQALTPEEDKTEAKSQALTFEVEKDEQEPVPEARNQSTAKKLSIGQEVLVQVVKEERGTKGAALTTFISLAGSYLVLMPNSPSVKGISRRIEGSARDEAKDITANLNCPESMGFIIRTAGINQSAAHLQWDLDALINLWNAISEQSKQHSSPVLMHQESDVISCAVRDHLRQDITDLVVNDKAAYEKITQYIKQIKPQFVEHVHLFDVPAPLFAHFGIENQIEQAQQREVRLPSGGAIIIDPTEALISVDVNSARAKGLDIEDTAYNTNLEAAEELAKQLRLRDIGGLIVIDFIDMGQNKHQREVESHLKRCLQEDRARIRLGKISSFGLLEMSRQRLRSSLGEVTKIECPRCAGHGMIQSVESLSLSLIRRMREDVMNEQLLQLQIHVPLEVCAQLMNHHRNQISDIETCGKTSLIIVPNPNYQSPQFKIKKIRFNDKATKAAQMESKSYQLIEPHRVQYQHEKSQHKKSQQQRNTPVVDAQLITQTHAKSPKQSLVKRLWEGIFNQSVIHVSAKEDDGEKVDDNIGNLKTTPNSSGHKKSRNEVSHRHPDKENRRDHNNSRTKRKPSQRNHRRPEQTTYKENSTQKKTANQSKKQVTSPHPTSPAETTRKGPNNAPKNKPVRNNSVNKMKESHTADPVKSKTPQVTVTSPQSEQKKADEKRPKTEKPNPRKKTEGQVKKATNTKDKPNKEGSDQSSTDT